MNEIYVDAHPARITSTHPSEYRLAKDPWGTLILQGGFYWSQGEEQGIEWKSLPTVELA